MRSKKAVYNIILNVVLQIIIIIYGFIIPKIIISNFGSNVNGLVSSITQFLAYIVLLESGFGPVVTSALYKPIAQKNDRDIINILRTSEKFFRSISLIFILYMIVLCFVFPLIINNNFDNIFTVSLIIIIGVTTFFEYFFGMTYKLFLKANQELYFISIIQIITYIISVIVIIILAKCGFGIHMIKLASGLIFIIRPILLNYYVKKKYKLDLNNSDSNYKLKQKWDGLAQHIAAVIHGNTDITILTFFTTLAEVSVYSVYYLVIKGIKSLIQSITGGLDATFGDIIAKNEKVNLNKRFEMYEVLFNSLSTIVFTCAILLIVPFISIYTKGVTDANYIRHTFGVLIVISEYIWAIRLPYGSITLAAGHFKETRNGAWIECLTNILISIILVWKYGIIGVTIGTIVAMTIRTIEFVYHSNKYILNRSIWKSIQKILLIVIETIIIVFICKYLPLKENINYLNWIINALMIFGVSSLITLTINYIFFKNEFKEIMNIFKRLLKKRQKGIKNDKN